MVQRKRQQAVIVDKGLQAATVSGGINMYWSNSSDTFLLLSYTYKEYVVTPTFLP